MSDKPISVPVPTRPRIRALRLPRVERRVLTSVTVEKLFGRFTYGPIEIGRESGRSNNLTVLYGDNGTGKSTLLKLIYAALSPNHGEGLRTYIAKTPFRSIEFRFSNGTSVLIRKLRDLTGSFTYKFFEKSSDSEVRISASANGTVPEQNAVVELERKLSALRINLLFVSHFRSILSTFNIFSSDDDEIDFYPLDSVRLSKSQRIRRNRNRFLLSDDDFPGFPLTDILNEVTSLFRTMSIRQGYTGDQDASQVYLDVINALASRSKKKTTEAFIQTSSIGDSLSNLKQRSEPYIRHGLLSDYKFDHLEKAISKAPTARHDEISSVLSPFLNSISRRLEAFKEVESIINDFEMELNKYFHDKKISLDILNGLRIFLDQNSALNAENPNIDPSSLSSGEQQLLFLFCVTLLIRDKGGLILIDEPELSLNYKWQRIIVSSILKLSAKSTTQFLMASHSIEVISKHKEAAYELKNGS